MQRLQVNREQAGRRALALIANPNQFNSMEQNWQNPPMNRIRYVGAPDPFAGTTYYPPGSNRPSNTTEQTRSELLPGLKEGLRLCPVERSRGVNTWMTPAKLYENRIDISPFGIWFDASELIQILDKMKDATIPFLLNWFKDSKTSASVISGKIQSLIKLRSEFELKHSRYVTLANIVSSDSPEKVHVIDEYHNLLVDLPKLRELILNPINISPGSDPIVVPVKPPVQILIAPEVNRLCPHMRGLGKAVPMVKVKLMGQALDASEHGIWFDNGELEALLLKLPKRNSGIRAFIASFLQQGNIPDHIHQAIADHITLIRARDQAHAELGQARASQNVQMEKTLLDRFEQLNSKIQVAYDITPDSLKD